MPRMAKLDARPQPLELDLARTAVLVIDMQNDFGSAGGMFDRAGIDISGIREAVAPTAAVLAAARRCDLKIVYLKMGYLPDLSDLGLPGAPNHTLHIDRFKVGDIVTAPDGSQGGTLIRDTWGTAIIDGLTPQVADTVLYKTRFSGFYRTELDELLRRSGIRHLIVTGCTTSICVESTIRDAAFRDYQCALLSDCTSEQLGMHESRSNRDVTLQLIEHIFGWVSDSKSVLRALATIGAPLN